MLRDVIPIICVVLRQQKASGSLDLCVFFRNMHGVLLHALFVVSASADIRRLGWTVLPPNTAIFVYIIFHLRSRKL